MICLFCIGMSQANCNNCENNWKLQKNPSSYSRGWPSCPNCGSTNIKVEGETKQEYYQQENQTQQIETKNRDQAEIQRRSGIDVVDEIVGGGSVALDENREATERVQGAALALKGIAEKTVEVADKYKEYQEENQRQQQQQLEEMLGESSPKKSNKYLCPNENCNHDLYYGYKKIDENTVQCPNCGTYCEARVSPDQQ